MPVWPLSTPCSATRRRAVPRNALLIRPGTGHLHRGHAITDVCYLGHAETDASLAAPDRTSPSAGATT